MNDAPALLVTVTGRDRPGLTAALFDVLVPLGAGVLDMEQVVIRDRLILGILLRPGADAQLTCRALQARGMELGVEVECEASAVERPGGSRPRQYVTVLGQPLQAAAVAGVTRRLAGVGANIDRIQRLSRYPITSLELVVSGAQPDRLRQVLAEEAAAQRVDIAVQRATLYRRAKRLVVMDVDSTLVQGEAIELLAEHTGSAEQVAAVTAAAMRGELDFEQALRQRVALLAGLPESVIAHVRTRLRLTPGARTLVRTLRRLGYVTGIVSGGFTQITDPLAADLGLDHALAQHPRDPRRPPDRRLVGPVVDRAGKAEALRRFAADAGVPLEQTVAVGDGANDLDMLAAAGLGIAFNAKPAVREAADTGRERAVPRRDPVRAGHHP